MRKHSLLAPLSDFLTVLFMIGIGSFAAVPSHTYAQSLPNLSGAAPATINITLKLDYQGVRAWSGTVTLDQGSTATIYDSNGDPHSIASDSALAALAQADNDTAAFNISDLAYYPAWSALYVNCIDIASGSKHACSDWMYSVDNQDPPMGADQMTLVDGDTVDFYFGSAASDTPAVDTADAPAAYTSMTHSGGHSGGGVGGGGMGGGFVSSSLPALPSISATPAVTVLTVQPATSTASSSVDDLSPSIRLDVTIADFIKHYLSFFGKAF